LLYITSGIASTRVLLHRLDREYIWVRSYSTLRLI